MARIESMRDGRLGTISGFPARLLSGMVSPSRSASSFERDIIATPRAAPDGDALKMLGVVRRGYHREVNKTLTQPVDNVVAAAVPHAVFDIGELLLKSGYQRAVRNGARPSTMPRFIVPLMPPSRLMTSC